MSRYQLQKQAVLQLLDRAAGTARHLEAAEVAGRLAEAARHLEEGKLVVVVAGEFKRGKSSLVNALLDEPGLFPVDVDITTNTVTSITYGTPETINVVTGEPGQEETQVIGREQIADYVSEQRNRGNARGARLLVIQSPNKQLREGLTLVDTPGVGSINRQHTAISYAFIPNADVVLFVGYALEPFSRDELAFLQERILPHSRKVIFVVTHVDVRTDYQTVVANNREKLAQVLDRPAGEIEIIPVSSQLKLDYLEYGEARDLEESNFEALESALWRLLTEERGAILLLRALNDLNEALTTLSAPLQAEWGAYHEQSSRALDDQENQLKALQARLQDLTRDSAEWRTQLAYGLEDLRADILNRYQRGMKIISRKEKDYLDDGRLLKRPADIISLLESDVDALVVELEKELGRQAAALHEQLASASQLSLADVIVTTVQRPGSVSRDANPNRTGWWEKSLRVARTAWFTAPIGAKIGAVVGGFAGAVVGGLFGGIGAAPGAAFGAQFGAVIGGLGGLSTSSRLALDEVRHKDRQTVARYTRDYLEDSGQMCVAALNRSITDLSRSMRDELQDAIRRESETVQQTVRSLQTARRSSAEQAARRTRELQPLLERLDQLQQDADALARAVLEAEPEPGLAELPAMAGTPDPYAAWADE